MKKRILACFMAVCMLVCLSITASAADVTYTDIGAGYAWAEEAIYRWTDAGVVGGKGGDTFDPAGLLKRSEAAKIFTNLLKLVEKSDKVYTDVPGTEWYAEYVAKCDEAGIMNGTSATEAIFEPETPVSREMVFTMICRALGIEGQETLNGTYEDADKVSDWAKPYVYALVNLGYVNGRTATTLAPQENMTRAEKMVLLHKVIGVYVTQPGTVAVSGTGVALVLADDVKLEGAFEGTVVVGAEAEVDLAGVTGTAQVIATVANVSIVNAPLGTTVTSANGATGVTVNGTQVEADDSATITEPTTPTDPVEPEQPVDPVEPEQPDEEKEEKPPVIVHIHSYKNWEPNEDGTTHTATCECGETKTEACKYGAWEQAGTDEDPQHAHFCEVCGKGVGANCVMVGTEATCVAEGVKECADCGRKVVTPATGHNFASCGHDEEDAMKFELSVESDAEVKATVYDDYSAVVVVPHGTVDAGSVTVSAKMQNVGSLGVDEMRKHSITVNTGITDKTAVSLDTWLGNAHHFTNATLNVTVGEAEEFVYTVAGNDGVITATPDDVDAARAAWMELTSYVSTGTSSDSSIVVKKGSYIAVGGEKLCFEDEAGDLTIDNVNNLEGLKQHIKDTVKVVDAETGTDMVIVVKAGTTLAVGSSSATLDADCKITLGDLNFYDNLDGTLNEIRNAGSKTTTEMLKSLVGLLNNVIGELEGADINVVVEFGNNF